MIIACMVLWWLIMAYFSAKVSKGFLGEPFDGYDLFLCLLGGPIVMLWVGLMRFLHFLAKFI